MSVSPNDLMDMKQRLENLEREQELRKITEKETIDGLSSMQNEINHLRNKENVFLGSGKKKLKPIKTTGQSALKDGEINTPISLDYFNQKITDLENETHQIKNQIKLILKRLETVADKFKSLSDFKKEFKAFFSRDGHSAILETNTIFKKVFWLSCMIALFVSGMWLVDKNVKGYLAHDVVTQVKVIDVEQLKFPTITFCLVEYNNNNISNDTEIIARNFSSAIISLYFDDFLYSKLDYFQHFSIYTNLWYNSYIDCYKFNSEKNANNHETKVLSTSRIGAESGLYMKLNLSQNDTLYYHVGTNRVKLLFSELKSLNTLNTVTNYIGMKKVVDVKLPIPYSDCSENINTDASDLVKEIIEQNITYRQKHCYEICYNKYMKEYVLTRNKTMHEALHEVNFDYTGNCSRLCPLECRSTSFEITKSEINLNTDYQGMNFFFTDRKFTEISQTEKTTGADLISSTGGVLGLFLELNFFSVIRFILYIFDFFLLLLK